MAAKKDTLTKKVPVISIEEMQTVNGNLIGGQVAAANRNIFNVYAYSLPTFDLLKKPIYQDALISVGMKPILDSLPWGVDLKACVDFFITYNKKTKTGTLQKPDGTQHQVTITEQLLEKATGMEASTWPPYTIQTLKQKGVIKSTAKDHIRYSDVLQEELASTLPALELLSMVTFAEIQQRVTALSLTCLLEKKTAFHYIWIQLNEGLRKATPILVNPQLLTRILYTAAEMPLPDPATSTEANLLSSMKNSFIVGSEAVAKATKKERVTPLPRATPEPSPQPEPSVQAQQSASVQETGESSDLAGTSEKSLQLVGVKHQEADPFNIQQLLHPNQINRKRHHDASNYFEGLSQKLQRLSTSPPPTVPNEEEEGVEKIKGVNKILEDTAGGVLLATHLVMQQSMHEIEKLFTSTTKAVEASYEAQLQQQKTELASLQAKLIHKDTELEEYKSTLKSAEEKYDSEIKAMFLKMANIEQKQQELQTSLEGTRQDNCRLVQENQALESKLQNTNRDMRAQAETLKAKTQEISALKAMDASERSMLEVDEANKKVTLVFNALGSVGLDICKPRKVSTTLELISGNVAVAMLYYKVDIKDLDAQSFQILLRNGNRYTKEFVIFLTLAQKIDLDWSLLLQQPIFLMVANLRVWATLFSYSSIFTEEENDILDMEPVVADILPGFATNQEQYRKNWKIMATIREEIIVIRKKMLSIPDKYYHHNGLCHLFTRIHSKMVAAMDNTLHSMEKDDIHYPANEEVADDEVYHQFLKLQIPGEPINLVSEDEDNGDDDDHHHQGPKNSEQDDANPKDHTNTSPPKSPPKDNQDKGKGKADGTNQSNPPTNSPPKVMEAAMKTRVDSSYVANPLIGLPNEAATSTRIIAEQGNRSMHRNIPPLRIAHAATSHSFATQCSTSKGTHYCPWDHGSSSPHQ